MQAGDAPEVSVVIPVYNNAPTLGTVVEQVIEHMTANGRSVEVVLVDDCSSDGSWASIETLAESDARVRGIRLASNGGSGTAKGAGCSVTRGPFICTVDADMDYDPCDLVRILEELEAGHDFVSGVRVDSSGRPPTRRLGSWVMRMLVSRVWSFVPRDIGCGVQGWTSEIAAMGLPQLETHRDFAWAVPLLQPVESYSEIELRTRESGLSSYGFVRQAARVAALAVAVATFEVPCLHRPRGPMVIDRVVGDGLTTGSVDMSGAGTPRST